jgi:hypothetical protein
MFFWTLASHWNRDAAIAQRHGKFSNQSYAFRGPRIESFRLVIFADAANHEGGRSRMPAVQNASQFFLRVSKTVELIHEQGG